MATPARAHIIGELSCGRVARHERACWWLRQLHPGQHALNVPRARQSPCQRGRVQQIYSRH
eukprot:4973406-Pleurochrysis_carterae.AAC.1